jgi:hypothetical protein
MFPPDFADFSRASWSCEGIIRCICQGLVLSGAPVGTLPSRAAPPTMRASSNELAVLALSQLRRILGIGHLILIQEP